MQWENFIYRSPLSLQITLRLILCSSMFGFAMPAIATSKSSDIETNRPSFTFSSIVVPKGSLQFENGVLYSWFRENEQQLSIPETQVRLGLLKNTEFQMFVPNILVLRTPDDTNSGAIHLGEVGFKQQLPNIKGLQSAVTASMNIPTGRNYFSGPGVQPVFRMPISMPIGKRYQICAMPSFLLLNAGRTSSYQQTVMLSRSIGSRASIFAEYGGFFYYGLPPLNIAHFGGTYKFTRRNQLDLECGFGLNRNAPTAFVGGGYSFRF